jgi:hypothetical protein
VNTGEQQQLRQWADRLCEAEDSERRAMGRAIAMLLDRIDELEQELSVVSAAPNGAVMRDEPDYEGAHVFDQEEEFEPGPVPSRLPPGLAEPLDIGEDTQQMTLRDRLRNLRDRVDL